MVFGPGSITHTLTDTRHYTSSKYRERYFNFIRWATGANFSNSTDFSNLADFARVGKVDSRVGYAYPAYPLATWLILYER